MFSPIGINVLRKCTIITGYVIKHVITFTNFTKFKGFLLLNLHLLNLKDFFKLTSRTTSEIKLHNKVYF